LSKVAHVKYYLWKVFSGRSGKGQYANINDIKMYYEIHGEGEPLLLLHGGLGFIETFYNQIPNLAKEFRVIAVDSRGHGRTTDSDKPLSYSLMASDMVKLLEHLKIDSAHVVGWSDGGVIGIDLAINHPNRIRKLVVIGAHFRAEDMSDAFIQLIKSTTAETLEKDDRFKVMIDFYKKMAPDPSHLPIFWEKIKHMWLTEPNYTEKELSNIKAQTLVLAGEDEEIVRLDHVRELSQAIPNAQLNVISDAGHSVPLEKPRLVNEAIINFLKGRN